MSVFTEQLYSGHALSELADFELLEPESVFPAQWFDDQDYTPVKRLMLAILLDAWRTLTQGRPWARQEAERWFRIRGTTLFSLSSICATLGVDERLIRQQATAAAAPRFLSTHKNYQRQRHLRIGSRAS